jgi:hypothetical protein
MQQSNMPLGENISDDMRSLHAMFCEFSMHIKGYMNLSLFSFFEFCTLKTGIKENGLHEIYSSI